MSLRVFSLGYVTLGVVLLLVSTAQAQLPQNRNQAMQQQQLLQRLQPVKTLGTLVAATADRLQLSNNQNQTIFVAIGPDTQVSVTGTAEQDYLKSGVTVEFLAEVAKGGTVKEKIDHLVIVSPTDDRPVGLFSPQSLEKKEEKGAKAEEENVNALAPIRPSATRRQPRDARPARTKAICLAAPRDQARQEQRVPAASRHIHGAGNDQAEQERRPHACGRSRPDDQGRIGRRRHDRR